jgi:hypothetical protein
VLARGLYFGKKEGNEGLCKVVTKSDIAMCIVEAGEVG